MLGALRAGVAANLLTADGPRLTWRHALTRDAVLATLLPPERAALAARLAEHLDLRPDADAGGPGGAAVGRGRPGRTAPSPRCSRWPALYADRGDLAPPSPWSAGQAPSVASTAVAEDLVRLLTLQGRLAEARSVGSASLDCARRRGARISRADPGRGCGGGRPTGPARSSCWTVPGRVTAARPARRRHPRRRTVRRRRPAPRRGAGRVGGGRGRRGGARRGRPGATSAPRWRWPAAAPGRATRWRLAGGSAGPRRSPPSTG